MKTAINVISWLLRLCGLIMLSLGLLFWTGNALNLIRVHIFVGMFLVLLLWTLALVGARARVPLGLVALALVWGVITPVLGMTQTQLLPGAFHWVIRVLHLLVGVAAVGQGEALAVRILRTYQPGTPTDSSSSAGSTATSR